MAEHPIPITAPAPAAPPEPHRAASLAAVQRALDELRFGQIVLTVHEGKVVQLDVTEKLRFTGN